MKKIILSKCFLHVVLLTLAFCLFPVLPAFTQEDIVNRLDKALGVTLPSEYKSKVKAFVQGSKVLEGDEAIFTEQFITQQMKEDWGINKQNQLLFIWDAIYEQITKKNFYDGEDGNKQRLADFEEAMDNIEACGKKYKQDIIAYMKQQSAEAKQEPIAYIYHTLYYMIYSYDFATDEEIKEMKEIGKNMIQLCNQYNIDYKSLFPLEVQKFYGIEPTVNQSNTLSCDKAKINILNIGLQEIVKLYNLYQKTPQVERKIETKHYIDYIETCKENNIDYKAILRKELGDDKKVQELLKFYGVE